MPSEHVICLPVGKYPRASVHQRLVVPSHRRRCAAHDTTP